MQTIEIEKLTPHARNNELPLLTKDELVGLKRLIEIHGFTEAVEITKQHVILDGHNRVEVAKELGMKKIPFRIIDIPESEEFSYILEKNASRRQMTAKKIAYLRGKLYLHMKGDGDGKKSEQIAKEDGVSEKTVRRDAKFAENLEATTEELPEIREKILNNEIKATAEDMKNIADLDKEKQKETLLKAEETLDLGTAYEEIHGTHEKGDKVIDLKMETLKSETEEKVKRIEVVLINKVKDINKKKKLHTAFEAFTKKIDSILSE